MIRERVLLAATGVVLVLAVLVWKRDSYVVDAEHARVLLGKGATQEAIAQLEMTAKQHPNDSYLQSLLGEAYMRRGAFSLAEAAYRRATREKPNDPLGWAGLAQSNVAEGKFYDSASAWVQAAQLSKSGGALYWFNAGQAYAHIGKLPEAIQAFQKAVALAPNATDAWGALGFAQLKAGQNQQAVTSLEKAVKLQPGNPDLRLILGNAYLAVGNQQQAQEQFFQASKLRAAMEERMKKMRQQQEPPKK
jgi:Flp pilus assembly protein TadD